MSLPEGDIPLIENRIEQLAPNICFNPCRTGATVIGNAFDLVLVQSLTGQTTCCNAMYSFGPVLSTPVIMCVAGGVLRPAQEIVLEVPRIDEDAVHFPIFNQKIHMPQRLGQGMEERLQMDEEDEHDEKALELLASFLKSGKNSARYLLLNDQHEIIALAPIHVFLWSDRDRIIVVDVDGTITKSNIRGVVDTVLIEQYTHCHNGVCEFLSSLNNGRLFYLTSRPIGLANSTRRFLSQLRQTDIQHQLPEGPLVGHMGTLSQVLLMELIYRSIHEFKATTLRETIVQPFLHHGVRNVFLAGFGNSLMDMQAYHMVGMDLRQIYLIDKQSNIYCLDQHKKAEPDSEEGTKPFPRPRKEYMHMRGTSFEGYQDDRLLTHVLEHIRD